MKVKASIIIRVCNDREYERKWQKHYVRQGYPPLEVIWDIPKTPRNLKLVNDFLRDYSDNPFVKNFLRKKEASEE